MTSYIIFDAYKSISSWLYKPISAVVFMLANSKQQLNDYNSYTTYDAQNKAESTCRVQ